MEKIYEEIIDEILALDNNIRYVGIIHGNVFHKKTQKNMKPYLNAEESEKSIQDAIFRWKQREELSDRLLPPRYTITRYGKVQRITISIPNGLLLISCEPDINPMEIIEKILAVRDWYIF